MRSLRLIFFSAALLLAHNATSVMRAAEATAPSATSLTRDQVIASLTLDLAAHFNVEGELQLELLRAWTAPTSSAAAWQLSVIEYPSAISSSMLVRCRLLGDSTTVAEPTFVLRASLFRDVWAARQPLTVGEGFNPAALETRRIDTLRERDVLPASAGDHTFIVARAVAAGRLLTWRDIARRPLVKKGELVDVSAADGLLVVTMKAVAMTNGARGETVTVRNPESRKDFAAMVIDENRVQVRF